jgi:hypothetical protein
MICITYYIIILIGSTLMVRGGVVERFRNVQMGLLS